MVTLVMNTLMMNKLLRYLITMIVVPAVIASGILLFGEKRYAFVSFAVAVLAVIAFFMAFEKKKSVDTKKTVILSVMITLSVLGRFVFAFIPFFKPVTAIVVILAIYFGPEMGFLCGSMSALLSNFYFGQGPWTPFQMFAWGMIGFLAGLSGEKLIGGKLWLALYGVFAGIFYSVSMDIWVVLWMEGDFVMSRYLAVVLTSLPDRKSTR